jgi:hypothetical protein
MREKKNESEKAHRDLEKMRDKKVTNKRLEGYEENV